MINITICDDDCSFTEIMQFKIEERMKNIGLECSVNSADSFDKIQEELISGSIDILFLDIMLNNVSSIDLLKNCPASKRTRIIIMTAFPTEAYNITEIDNCTFLVKTRLSDDLLAKALQKALDQMSNINVDMRTVASKNKSYMLNLRDILYIETISGNHISIVMTDLSKIVIHKTLTAFADTLPSYFLRCHNSYIINVNHITGYAHYYFTTTAGINVPIPAKKYSSIIKKL